MNARSQRRAERKAQRKRQAKIGAYLVLPAIVGTAVIWMVLLYTGLNLPYIYTKFALQLRMYFILPFLVTVLLVLRSAGISGERRTSAKKEQPRFGGSALRNKEAIKEFFVLILAAFFFSWSSVAFSAWTAKLFATETFTREFQITKIGTHAKRSSNSLALVDQRNGEHVDLVLRTERYRDGRWKVGDTICVKGRTSIFGSISDGEFRQSEAQSGCQ